MPDANPLNLARIDHVVIRANNIERLIAFYCDVLGCRLERGPGELGLAQLRAGDSLIDLVDVLGPLGAAGGEAPDGRAPNMDHVCFFVEPWDADSILEYLHAKGVETGEVEVRYGSTGMGPSIYLCDPEGNNLELKGRS